MAKFKKFPKQPKVTASLATLENYYKKVLEVKKENDKIKADKKKKTDLLKKANDLKHK